MLLRVPGCPLPVMLMDPVREVKIDGMTLLDIVVKSLQQLPETQTGVIFGSYEDGVVHVHDWMPESTEELKEDALEAMRLTGSYTNPVGWVHTSLQGILFRQLFHDMHKSWLEGCPHAVCLCLDPQALSTGSLSLRAITFSAEEDGDRFIEIPVVIESNPATQLGAQSGALPPVLPLSFCASRRLERAVEMLNLAVETHRADNRRLMWLRKGNQGNEIAVQELTSSLSEEYVRLMSRVVDEACGCLERESHTVNAWHGE
ncbi:hypothetical protein KIPB_003911 [Kipferlia bialata]|uniref:Uncharacterized protein n=1 Tax=Kipferlia bialata TaxID=797122 RepID=A0A391NQI3_9EUKA|nr:hypothetical protein KIPB_003911 [Kipferlia bialata]|eukprot:g3911.t1